MSPGRFKFPPFRPFPAALRLGLALALYLAWTAAAPAQAQEGRVAEIPYQAEIRGVKEKDVVELLRSVSSTFELKNRPPETLSLLKRRAERDIPRMVEALGSEGWFKAKIEVGVSEEESRRLVVFNVDPGPDFILETVNIQPAPGNGPETGTLPAAADVGLEIGKRFRASEIPTAQANILVFLKNKGRPFPEVANRKIVADFARNTVRVDFLVKAGASARFGQTAVTGLTGVEEPFVRRQVLWDQGGVYNADLVAKTRLKLYQTGLFSLVTITPEPVDELGRTSMTILLEERKHRTVSAGLYYRTDKGVGAKTGWQHRNLFKGGEKLDLTLEGNQEDLIFNSDFTIPSFLGDKNKLILGSRLADENTEAYDARSLNLSAKLERQFDRRNSAGAGVGYGFTRTTEKNHVSFSRVYFPVYYTRDFRDNLLDPSQGSYFNVQAAPYFGVGTDSNRYLKYRASYRHYFDLSSDRRNILAIQSSYGGISAASLGDVPVDDRYYAGGGASVRGFAFQEAGDLDSSEDPIGGLSIFEISAEARRRIGKNMGLAAFVDGGRAFETEYPRPRDSLFWGAGMGFRYYTDFAPIRFDVAVPLNKRPSDSPYQVYISIGQAF